MRTFVAATAAALLIATSALAATDVGSLTPGKPAGVKQAQDDGSTIMYIVAGGVVIAGVALIASGNGNNNIVTTTTR